MGNLLAGGAMRKLTPPDELFEELNEERRQGRGGGAPGGKPWTGVHQDIYGRVIVVSDGEKKVVIAGADMGSFPNCKATAKRLFEEFGIENSACIFSATHNHESGGATIAENPDRVPEEFRRTEPGSASDRYAIWMVEQYVDAVREAISKLAPARMGVIRGESFINACRDLQSPCGGIQANNFRQNNDHELLVIKFESLDGEPIGIYANFACHSNYMYWNMFDGSFSKIGADVGGGVSRFVEKANKNKCPVIWAQAAAGDQNPILRSSWRIVNVNDEGEFSLEQVIFNYEDNLKQMASLCSTQGLEIYDLCNNITEWTDEFSFKAAETYRSMPARKSYNSIIPHDPRGLGLKLDERPEPVPYDPPREVTLYFRLAELCGVSFANINNESYCGLGKIIKKLMPTKYTAVQTVAWGGVGYFPDVEGERLNGLGTCNTPAWTAQHVEDAYNSAFTELRQEVFGK